MCEACRGSQTLGTSEVWPLLEGLVAAATLLYAWRRQEGLRLRKLLAIAFLLQVGWVAVHLALGVHSDFDSSVVYPREGRALLHGHYPDTEYPPGAIVLFAFDALVSGGGGEAVRIAHALVMVPFQLATVAAIWAVRARWSAWPAAVAAVWPANAFFWEFKYDLAPTAALVVGLVLALRERWLPAGVLLGVGAALKWTPGLAAAALVVWLLASGRRRDAARHAAGAAGAFLLVNAPFLIGWPGRVAHTYREQAGRGITGESFQYLLLRLVGRAQIPPGAPFWSGVSTPSWAAHGAAAVQIVCVAAVLAAAAGCRNRPRAAVAVAALAPAVFLLTTRTFSPQYLVTILAAWLVAASLVVRGRREQLAIVALAAGSTLANVLVYPTITPTYWWACSWLLFLFGFAATLWLLVRSLQQPR